MTTTMIPDHELIEDADIITVWVATNDAPSDMWSLREAIVWIRTQSDHTKIALFRPPSPGVRAAWLKPDQIERLAFALAPEPASSAA